MMAGYCATEKKSTSDCPPLAAIPSLSYLRHHLHPTPRLQHNPRATAEEPLARVYAQGQERPGGLMQGRLTGRNSDSGTKSGSGPSHAARARTRPRGGCRTGDAASAGTSLRRVALILM